MTTHDKHWHRTRRRVSTHLSLCMLPCAMCICNVCTISRAPVPFAYKYIMEHEVHQKDHSEIDCTSSLCCHMFVFCSVVSSLLCSCCVLCVFLFSVPSIMKRAAGRRVYVATTSAATAVKRLSNGSCTGKSSNPCSCRGTSRSTECQLYVSTTTTKKCSLMNKNCRLIHDINTLRPSIFRQLFKASFTHGTCYTLST